MYFRTYQASCLLCRAGSRKMQPLRNPVPLLQRLPAAFTTCTSSRSVVPRTRAMGTARQLGSTGAAKASQLTVCIRSLGQEMTKKRLHAEQFSGQPRAPLVDPASRRFQLGLGTARKRPWGPRRRPAGRRARCRGAHETGSPELWGSIATP